MGTKLRFKTLIVASRTSKSLDTDTLTGSSEYSISTLRLNSLPETKPSMSVGYEIHIMGKLTTVSSSQQFETLDRLSRGSWQRPLSTGVHRITREKFSKSFNPMGVIYGLPRLERNGSNPCAQGQRTSKDSYIVKYVKPSLNFESREKNVELSNWPT